MTNKNFSQGVTKVRGQSKNIEPNRPIFRNGSASDTPNHSDGVDEEDDYDDETSP